MNDITNNEVANKDTTKNETVDCTKTALEELRSKIEISTKASYERSRILMLHSIYSQWTLALLAVGQVVISVLEKYFDFQQNQKNFLSFGGVFFGVLVIAYSLLLAMSNYYYRAKKTHQCGLDFSQLAEGLPLHICGGKITSEQYLKALKRYYKILSKCENHKEIDCRDVKEKEDNKNIKANEEKKRSIDKAFNLIIKWFSFSHYVLSILAIIIWIALAFFISPLKENLTPFYSILI
jgi:hypothetical protein